jgi:Ca2+-transporting ATPase
MPTDLSDNKRWAAMPHDQLLSRFEVDPDVGLSLQEAEKRLLRYGPNQLEQRDAVSPWRILLAQFQDLMVLILLASTVVAFVSWYLDGAEGLPADGIVILAIVVANAWLGFSQEYKAERTIQELKNSTRATARVLRNGVLEEVDQGLLVPGDVVEVAEGDLVPADLVLFQASALRADESLLTGESVPVDKVARPVEGERVISERHNELFSGTVITAGTGRALVVETGGRTELGQIADTLQRTEAEPTPLEQKLDALGRKIGWGVLILSVLIGLVVLLVEGRADTPTLIRVAMFAVALAVAAVPEGLPAVLTVSLSIGARRLTENNVICRQMSAVETLGSVTTIVTDKTGTLTENQMTIRRLFTGRQEIAVTGNGYACEGAIQGEDQGLLDLMECGVLASGGDLSIEVDGSVSAVGDPMDAGFLVLAEKGGVAWRELRQDWKQVGGIPFSSERARVCILRHNGQRKSSFVKGAPRSVMERCRYDREGKALSEESLNSYRRVEEEFGKEALRGLALARRDLPGGSDSWENELMMLGLVGFEDPPRKDVPEAISRCHQAGIKVVMCTGDHPATATAIGRQIGLGGERPALTGQQAEDMEPSVLAREGREGEILARFSPSQKLSFVESLISQGEVVAMTGDGVNDAPALKKVHVGVSMGKGGTAVAVEASDLVLTDDRFSNIVLAVQEGRAVFHNIQRFIAFLFSGNFGVVVAMFVGTLLAGFFDLRSGGSIILPLSAAQILWMNLVTDGAPALAFALGKEL